MKRTVLMSQEKLAAEFDRYEPACLFDFVEHVLRQFAPAGKNLVEVIELDGRNLTRFRRELSILKQRR